LFGLRESWRRKKEERRKKKDRKRKRKRRRRRKGGGKGNLRNLDDNILVGKIRDYKVTDVWEFGSFQIYW